MVDLNALGALTINMLSVSNYWGRSIEAECQKLCYSSDTTKLKRIYWLKASSVLILSTPQMVTLALT